VFEPNVILVLGKTPLGEVEGAQQLTAPLSFPDRSEPPLDADLQVRNSSPPSTERGQLRRMRRRGSCAQAAAAVGCALALRAGRNGPKHVDQLARNPPRHGISPLGAVIAMVVISPIRGARPS
jgi:hypothetical protein